MTPAALIRVEQRAHVGSVARHVPRHIAAIRDGLCRWPLLIPIMGVSCDVALVLLGGAELLGVVAGMACVYLGTYLVLEQKHAPHK